MRSLISKAQAVLPENFKRDRQAKAFTTNYKHWSGGDVYGSMPYAESWMDEHKYVMVYDLDDEDTMLVGVAPMPKGNWQWFWFHWHHGRLMRYDRLSTLVFCLRNYKRPVL